MNDTIRRDTILQKIKDNDVATNHLLVDRYPWLCPRRKEDGSVADDYDYTWTELYHVPYGWVGLVLDLCEEIRQILIMYNIPLKYYLLLEVKEKWGGLCWNDSLMGFDPMPEQVQEVVQSAEEISYNHCLVCGNKKQTNGYYCDECAGKA